MKSIGFRSAYLVLVGRWLRAALFRVTLSGFGPAFIVAGVNEVA